MSILGLLSSTKSDLARPPGPRGLKTIQIQLDFARDQIGFFRSMARTYGPASYFRLGTFQAYLFDDPSAIEEVLLKKSGSFHKDALTHELDELLGRGLITSEDEHWRRQRKLISPAFRRRHIDHYAAVMVEHAQQMVASWRDGEVRPFHHDMMEVTLRIVVEALFNQQLDEDVTQIGEWLDVLMQYFHESCHTLWRFLPEPLPTPTRREFVETSARLDEMIYGLIDARRRDGTPGDDLLWQMLVAVDDEGDQMTDQQLRDEVMTLFLAGHETTALAITYTWHLLTARPQIMRRLHAEVDEVLDGRLPTADDSKKLPYTRAVVQEAMRLYPPAWAIGREAMEDVEIGGWTVPKGAQVLISQAVLHRNPRFYDQPDVFRPERWLDGLEDRLPRYAYMPFGGGPRVCIGNYFAMMEAILVVATIAQQVSLEDVSPEPLRLQPSVTLRPLSPIAMRVQRR